MVRKLLSVGLKSILLTLVLSSQPIIALSQEDDYFQQGVKYDIEADLVSEDTLKASCRITYQNNSNRPLDTLFFHLWMNALGDKSSPFSKQLLKANDRSFYFLKEAEMGGYTSINVKVNQSYAKLKYKDKSREIAYLVLSNTLASGQSVVLQFDYTLKIPTLVTRMGRSNEIINLVHWYPKPAVFDDKGWHIMPYLSWGEYYSEYGDFTITLTHKEEVQVSTSFIKKQTPTKTIIKQQQVGDLPIFIFPHKQNIVSLEGKSSSVDININFHSQKKIWDYALDYTKEVIEFFEKEIGPFPYDELTVVQGSLNQSSAMEYPGTIIINKISSLRDLDYYLAHEIAHQYFYAALGFNERDEAFMDEGLATFYEDKYTVAKYGDHHYNAKIPRIIHLPDKPLVNILGHNHLCARRRCKAFNTPPDESHIIAYALNAYPRSAMLFQTIEKQLGREKFKSAIHKIYSTHKHKHISSTTFFQELERETRHSMQWINNVISGEGFNLSTIKKNKDTKLIISSTATNYPIHLIASGLDTVLSAKGDAILLDKSILKYKDLHIDPYKLTSNSFRKNRINRSMIPNLKPGLNMGSPNRTNISILPSLYYNTSDSWMPGVALFNSTLPSKTMKWLVNPTYSFKNKELNGEAWFSHDFFISDTKYLQPKVSAKKYSFRRNDNLGFHLGYNKLTAALSYHISDTENWDKHQSISFSYMRIIEDQSFFTNSEDYTIEEESFSNIRLQYDYANSNGITKSKYNLTVDAVPQYRNGNFFVRTTASIFKKIFYNPSKAISARIWAGYFIENTKRNVLTYNDRLLVKGSLGLIQNSYNDYTYDGYYLDRNNNNINQAPTHNGGGFIVQFDGNRPLGQSNDLAFALNLELDAPLRLPKFLPIKLFFDIGGYTQKSRSEPSNILYLYSGGIKLKYLNEAIAINIPFFNSNEINNVFLEESRSFLNRISFTIDFFKLNPWKNLDQMNFFQS